MTARLTVAAASTLVAVLLAGCVSDRGGGSDRAAAGQATAEARCGACHALGGQSRGPNTMAPSFAELRVRFNAIAWERTLKDISEGRHEGMPPISIDEMDIRDLRAFVTR